MAAQAPSPEQPWPARSATCNMIYKAPPQACSSAEFIENIEIDENLIQVLQGTLERTSGQKIFGAIDRRQLPAADANVIELVGMMFEYMLQEEDLPNLVKALLSRLHTPMLKVAVIDKTFFTHAGHSARKLLNDMTRAGKRWVDESAIDRGIFPTDACDR